MPLGKKAALGLKTERLILRPFQSDDLDLIQRLYCNDQILKYTPFDALSKSQAETHLEQIICDWGQPPRFNYEMAVLLRNTVIRKIKHGRGKR